ncbi:hypothetical protein LPJ66_006690 [Kickxella alabastrina]|uniref:Uncharacterized protein n=1 Tax=Kickxella alabastrina TaxID=61397 RepID=A0ACC1IDB5_9FUNG|nr:hypothetical protein LPJ66_006690 [Kickxella alabastrina]
MTSIKPAIISKRSTSSPTRPLLFSRLEVQYTDPDLKREALSELFDHCMSPICSTTPSLTTSRYTSGTGLAGSNDGLRARPMSAAPLFDLDLSNRILPNAPVSINSGLISPVTSYSDEGALFCNRQQHQHQLRQHERTESQVEHFGQYAEDNGEEYDDDGYGMYECVGSFKQSAELGTFADLRRKLYGSDLHASAQAPTN